MKLYKMKLTHCFECPDYWDHWGENVCTNSKTSMRGIYLNGAMQFPEWCPLEQTKEGEK